ncbi:hypothetical protein JOD63_000712 [Microbacterium terrae]|uniref:Uncharacterized protein n=1 Tax=Microbacterium terrae TaxID=69369 RepID=A0A0M2HE75_9MICO|nr:hypothetical protein [Microbacterium terrae]KJL44920.1 hypothetical protein RS81_00388 [Microbacterium terrae]MBP1076744.1 hypothetical protein [Microbacterium terrae]GLJ97575.1 hypothetical protein GCM10017594_07720 [Microbacterium terrae]
MAAEGCAQVCVDTGRVRYRLMNDYSADWPFWHGGLCADGDPALPDDLAADARAWAAQFNDFFSYEHGWPDQAIASAHEAEGVRLFHEVSRALPEHTVELQYWERAVHSDD